MTKDWEIKIGKTRSGIDEIGKERLGKERLGKEKMEEEKTEVKRLRKELTCCDKILIVSNLCHPGTGTFRVNHLIHPPSNAPAYWK